MLIKTLLLTLTLFLANTALALDLDSAKAAGLIGEQINGYLGVVNKPASSEAEALVKDINSKRRAKYQEIATKNGTDLSAVEKQAGQKLIEKTASGHYINTGSSWQKK